MKSLFFFFLFLFSLLECEAQKAVVANDKMNIVYLGVSNLLNVSVEGLTCSDFSIQTDNGIIEKGSSNCSFIYNPASLGKSSIRIVNANGKILDVVDFRVKPIPYPVAEVGVKEGGKVSKEFFLNKFGVNLSLKGFEWNVRFKNLGFTVTIESGKETKKIQNVGALFSKEVKVYLAQLKVGDKVYFTNILSEAPTKDTVNINPIEFSIME